MVFYFLKNQGVRDMYTLYRIKIWFIQTFCCVHEWEVVVKDIPFHGTLYRCKKCGKGTTKT